MLGLGKKRSKYGRFMDAHKIKQEDVSHTTKLNRDTITKAFNEDDPAMRLITKKALVDAAKKLTGEKVSMSDFW